MTVDMDAKIEGGDGSMGGAYSLAPEGDISKGTGILMEFTGKVEKNPNDNESLMVETHYIDDPTARCTIFCKLSEPAGLIKLVDIIAMSGVDKKIQKKKPSFNVKDLTGKILNNPGFHVQLANDIQGCKILATIKHSKSSNNKEKVEKTYANINKIAPVMKGSVPVAQNTAVATGNPPASNSATNDPVEESW